jgi:predicted nucleic acid-binding protein
VSDRIIFDTDVLIDAGRGVDAALEVLARAEEAHTPAISSITLMELIVGCRNKAETRALDRFVGRFSVLPLDEAVTDEGVRLLREYRLSHGLLIPDALIAATAMGYRVPLVSKNQRDYRFIPDLLLLPYPDPFGSPPTS